MNKHKKRATHKEFDKRMNQQRLDETLTKGNTTEWLASENQETNTWKSEANPHKMRFIQSSDGRYFVNMQLLMFLYR